MLEVTLLLLQARGGRRLHVPSTSRRRISRTISQSLRCDGSSGGLHSSSGSPTLPTSTTNHADNHALALAVAARRVGDDGTTRNVVVLD